METTFPSAATADKPVIPNNKWDDTVLGGWEVFVFAIHYNWLRFENGICNKMFSD